MIYDLNQIEDPKRFQRLVNTFLTERFGEDARLTPLQGTDGGSDGETAPNNPYIEFRPSTDILSSNKVNETIPRPGRYLFQVKYHRTGEQRLSDVRALVVREFEKELVENVLARSDRRDVTYFFLVTNVFASRDSVAKLDDIRKRVLRGRRTLHADIWWGERIVAHLDTSPKVWSSFPEIFPGSVPPMIAQVVNESAAGVAQAFRLSAVHEYDRDSVIKFRQIELAQNLFDLFVDLDVEIHIGADDSISMSKLEALSRPLGRRTGIGPLERLLDRRSPLTALELLIDDDLSLGKILLEGGPGQGKSTITQMAAQIYREKVIGHDGGTSRNKAWSQTCKLRFPFRIELRPFSVWLSGRENGSLEGYIAQTIAAGAGGRSVTIEDIQRFVTQSSVILFLDGLDEIGSDSLRDRAVDAIVATIRRFEEGLSADLRVVLTTRPPALAGRRNRLAGFARVVLMPMKPSRIDDYLNRWIGAQIKTTDEQGRIRRSFDARRGDPHVEALARNPMQLSVLLQFIYLKGEAFPDRRADLYREYFRIVIDRDVEKSPELADNREVVEELHAFLGFQLQGMTEVDQRGRALNRDNMIDLAGRWLAKDGHSVGVAERFFALGEERFGLIVARSGEGRETTYGFEVQPIQEYFAASYISDQLAAGRAHEIFEKLIHRNYWREVVLFLAGLRRRNEKSDLVARARNADRYTERGWQQNGRAIVLQLLREGVLRQPGHVREDAVNLVVDFLDLNEFRVQLTPEALVETICFLGKQFPSQNLNSRIARLVKDSSDSLDEYAVTTVHRVASVVLPKNEYTPLSLGYRGGDPGIRSLVRMTVPYNPESSADLRTIASDEDYWADVPVAMWARRLWRSALQHGYVLDVPYPPAMQSSLIVEFATDYRMPRERDVAATRVLSPRPFAIWMLHQNAQLAYRILQNGIDGSSVDEVREEDFGGLRERVGVSDGILDYRYLEDGVVRCIKNLVGTSNEMLTAFERSDRRSIRKKTQEYIAAIVNHLNDPGISGWVACRCAVDIVERRSGLWPLNVGDRRIDDLVELVREFYGANSRPRSFRRFPLPWQYGMPLSVRLCHGGSPVPLSDIISEMIRGTLGSDAEIMCWWIRDIPLPGVVIKPMVEACREDLSELLRFVGDRRLVGLVGERRLRVQQARSILKICRETDERDVLCGAGTVLLQAALERIAKPEVIAKILSAAPSSPLLFHVLRIVGDSVRSPLRSRSDPEVPLSLKIARLILSRSQEFPSGVVIQVAAFMAEKEPLDNAPLFEEFPMLAEEP